MKNPHKKSLGEDATWCPFFSTFCPGGCKERGKCWKKETEDSHG